MQRTDGDAKGSPVGETSGTLNNDIYQQDGDYIKDIEVNDLRNRYTLTKGATQKMVTIPFEFSSCPLMQPISAFLHVHTWRETNVLAQHGFVERTREEEYRRLTHQFLHQAPCCWHRHPPRFAIR